MPSIAYVNYVANIFLTKNNQAYEMSKSMFYFQPYWNWKML